MARAYSYKEALRILGAGNSAVLDAADSASAAALLGLGVFDLFEARSTLFGLADKLRRTLGAKLRGHDRLSRTERVYAACAVLAFASIFEVIDEAWRSLGASAKPDFTRADRQSIVHVLTDMPVIHTYSLVPGINSDLSGTAVGQFVEGLAQWDGLDETQQDRLAEFFGSRLFEAVADRYREYQVRLAADCAEFGVWLALDDHDHTRATVRRGFEELRAVLSAMSAQQAPDRWRRSLSLAHQAVLDRAVTQGDETTNGLRIPTLGEAYVDHHYRAADDGRTGIGNDYWWDARQLRTNLEEFIAAHLLADSHTPLLILGHPGSGKSVLTRFLAARLPAEDYLVVRVELRQVPAEAELLDQIEHAIRLTLHESVSWPQLVEAAAGAQPVLILDGFDELLQATGVSQSDYLIRVRRFQQQEADLGRPVSVVVTSRTAVADRAEIPATTPVIRLEPFDAAQIDAWLGVWNEINGTTLRARSLKPLTAVDVLRFPDLAAQPLLLLMLALYDASANALQKAHAELDHAELYDRLLRDFARREISKDPTGSELEPLIDAELVDLSVVAFAMFNRRAQWVDEAGLNADLTALGLGRLRAPSSFRKPLTSAQLLFGRFFFVHSSQATRNGEGSSTYEFLHATFGEYLIASLTVRLLVEAARRETASVFPVSRPVDDAMLYALLSFECLATRAPIIEFVDALLRKQSPQVRRAVEDVLLRMHSTALETRTESAYAAYLPVRADLAERLAVWSANLVVLATIAALGKLPVIRLFPGDAEAAIEKWHRETKLWRAALPSDGWRAFVSGVAVERAWDGGDRSIVLRLGRSPSEPAADLTWTLNADRDAIVMFALDPASSIMRSNAQASIGQDIVQHALAPVTSAFPALAHRVIPIGGEVVSMAHVLAEALIDPGPASVADLRQVILEMDRWLVVREEHDRFREVAHRIALGAFATGRLSAEAYEEFCQAAWPDATTRPIPPASEASPPRSPSPAGSSPGSPATRPPAP